MPADTWSGHDAPRPTARQNMLPGRDSRLSIVEYDHKEHVSMLGLSRSGHNGRQCQLTMSLEGGPRPAGAPRRRVRDRTGPLGRPSPPPRSYIHPHDSNEAYMTQIEQISLIYSTPIRSNCPEYILQIPLKSTLSGERLHGRHIYLQESRVLQPVLTSC